MDDLEKLYKRGSSATDVLRYIQVTTTRGKVSEIPYWPGGAASSISPSIDDTINYCSTGIQQSQGNNSAIEKYNEIIKALNKRSIDLFCKWGVDRHYCAMGYDSISNPNIIVIPPKQWNFLQVDIKKSSCSYEGISYYGLRFIAAEEILKLSMELRARLEREIKFTEKQSQPNQRMPTGHSIKTHTSQRVFPTQPFKKPEKQVIQQDSVNLAATKINTKLQASVATKKAVGKKNKLRIKSLKVFIQDLQATAIRENFDFDPEHMGCNKKILLQAIKQWAKKRKDNSIKLWHIDKFDNNLWLSDKRQSICDVEASPSKQSADFFEKFNL